MQNNSAENSISGEICKCDFGRDLQISSKIIKNEMCKHSTADNLISGNSVKKSKIIKYGSVQT